MDNASSREKQNTVRISVRSLVEFILRSGDLDNRRGGGFDAEAMLAGGRAHRRIQKGMAGDYQAETALYDVIDCGRYDLRIEGRADGVFTDDGKMTAPPQAGEELPMVVVDEIKGIYMDVDSLEEPVEVHLAQAKCYGAILLRSYLGEGWNDSPCRTDMIGVRMTYVNLEDDKQMRYFTSVYPRDEILTWYDRLCDAYRKWADWQISWLDTRDSSMEPLTFPFEYRKGQKNLVSSVYHTIREEKELFLMAPTGVGKTMSVVYPSVRSLGGGLMDKIFYLTAKNQTLQVGAEAFRILTDRGLRMKTILLTSKEKICPLNEPSCNPDDCSYARGHFDRINDAVYELIQQDDFFDRDVIRKHADKWHVCPFELGLDTSSWCDAVLCDYNYAFDPNARLRRFFGEGAKGRYIFLVDEAHNLVDRAREMYSAEIIKEDVLAAKNAIKKTRPKAAKQLERLNRHLLDMRKSLEALEAEEPRKLNVYEKIGQLDEKFVNEMLRSYGELQTYFKEKNIRGDRDAGNGAGGSAEPDEEAAGGRASDEETDVVKASDDEAVDRNAADGNVPGGKAAGDPLLDFYFRLRDFTAAYESMDDDYVIYTFRDEDRHFHLKLFCVNPARRLQEMVDKGKTAVFFSATLLPVGYYKTLLSRREDNYAVYAETPFTDDQKIILIGSDVSTRYRSRSTDMYRRIARYIHETVTARRGNYIAFFPSYRFMQDVLNVYRQEFDEDDVNYVAQSRYMSEVDREIFLENFYEDPAMSMVGFCVMGGVFAEGIDLVGSKLIGAIVVGCGLPQVSAETEILRDYYDHVNDADRSQAQDDGTAGRHTEKHGFSYAYLIPGMNKVLQSAGRVIRTATDRGVIVLLDDRFLTRECQEMFPREWSTYVPCRADQVRSILTDFWVAADDPSPGGHEDSEESPGMV